MVNLAHGPSLPRSTSPMGQVYHSQPRPWARSTSQVPKSTTKPVFLATRSNRFFQVHACLLYCWLIDLIILSVRKWIFCDLKRFHRFEGMWHSDQKQICHMFTNKSQLHNYGLTSFHCHDYWWMMYLKLLAEGRQIYRALLLHFSLRSEEYCSCS